MDGSASHLKKLPTHSKSNPQKRKATNDVASTYAPLSTPTIGPDIGHRFGNAFARDAFLD